jgi:predicted dehydrogenase
MIGLIGRGYWGEVYARTLDKMGIDYWQAGRNWREKPIPEAVIIASSAKSHYRLAKELISREIPVIIEKPVCLESSQARKLLKLARYKGISVFVGHTHLFSEEWRKLKKEIGPIREINAQSGGPCALDPLWDWGPHDVAMCIDLLDSPSVVGRNGKYLRLEWKQSHADLIISSNKTERVFDVDGYKYLAVKTDPTPLEVLISEFLSSKSDVSHLELGVKVVEVLEAARRVD